jgi:hypothetical protein
MDLGGGQRVAFFLPTDDIESARKSLAGTSKRCTRAGHTSDSLTHEAATASSWRMSICTDGALALAG